MNKSPILKVASAALLAALLAGAVFVSPARAAGYVVNSTSDNTTDDAFCTLREAIDAANNASTNANCGPDSGANDTITFSVSGPIILGSQLPAIVSGQGTLTINGGGNVTVSGNSAFRVLQVNSSATLNLEDITISDGWFSSEGGAGVLNNGTLNVTRSTFSGNTLLGSSGSIWGGAAIRNNGGATLTITDSTFSGNTGTDNPFCSVCISGGAIFHIGALLTIEGSTFSNNSTNKSAGAISNGSAMTIADSVFTGNSAFIGGAISTGNLTTSNISHTTFSGNTAAQGGAIDNNVQTIYIHNSTFYNNTANSTGGGGVYNSSGTTVLQNVTMSGNSEALGRSNGVVYVGNTIITNSTLNNCASVSDITTVAGNNVQFGGTTSLSCGASIPEFDPGLGAVTGSPAFFPLNSGSQAIDAGDDVTCANAEVNNESQNGVTRPADGDGDGTPTCDIGSYEAPAIEAEYSANPADGATLAFSGALGAAPVLDIQVTNTGDAGTDLDVDLTSITPGYSIVSGLPINNLQTTSSALTILVQCDSVPQLDGTLVLSTSDPNNSSVSYDLTCSVASSGGGGSGSDDGGDAAPQEERMSVPVAPSGTTAFSFKRLYVAVPSSAIPAGVTDCRIVVIALAEPGSAFGFALDDVVYDIKILCNGVELNNLADSINICIRPKDGSPTNKQIFHSHAGANFTAMANGVGPTHYVCGSTRTLSLFTLGQLVLPATGFAPGVVTRVGQQLSVYKASELILRIPALNVQLDIMGVPLLNGDWDVSWLAPTQAGYLYGTAFPTWEGNSVLTGHVWNADNTPGPFYHLKKLQHGDQFTIAAYGFIYTYEVRSNRLVSENNLSVMNSSDYSLITLITCEAFNVNTGEYLYRRAVQAVLVSVD